MTENNPTFAALLDEIKRQNETGIAVRGNKRYTSVAVRNEVARRFLGDGIGISTEIVHWGKEKGTPIVVKATIRRTADDRVIATGHAEEIRGQGNVNTTSALENAETSAIGRALAALGCSGGEFASANELEGVDRKRDAQAETPHDPETGEVRDERHPPQVPDPGEDADPPSVRRLIDQVREVLSMSGVIRPTRDQLEHAYAMAVIENIAKRTAKTWFELFVRLHDAAISRIQDQGLRKQVRSAIALKRAQIEGKNPDPADFGFPFGGEPIIALGEQPVPLP